MGLRAWHAVRVLSGPPRTPMQTAVSRSLANSPQFAGIFAVQIPDVPSLSHAEVAIALILAPQSPAPEIRFPACGQGHGQRLGSHATETGLHAKRSERNWIGI